MRRTLALLSVLAATSAALLGPVAPATAAAPVVDLKPGALPLGEAPQVPYVDGTVVVDGDRRIETGAAEVQLLGTSGSAVIVAVSYADGPSPRVLRIEADDSRTVVTKRVDIGGVVLSDDGSRLVRVDDVRGPTSRATLIDTGTAKVLATRTVKGYLEARDVQGGKVLLVGYRPNRTLLWRTGPDQVRTVLRTFATYADLGSNRISWFEGSPYNNGCQVLATLSAPRERIWRSCRDAVASISPDGSRLLTLHKLTDGVGPSELKLRDGDGTLLATYRVQGWFTQWQWEDEHTLLLGANGKKRYAYVRCVGADCERTGPTGPAQQA